MFTVLGPKFLTWNECSKIGLHELGVDFGDLSLSLDKSPGLHIQPQSWP